MLLPQAATAQTPAGQQFIQCINPGQPLLRIPELVSHNGKLRGSILLEVEADRMNLGKTGANCVPQYVRAYRGLHATLPGYQGSIPAGYPGATPPQPQSQYPDPMPGPTLRARVGDIVELTFLNQIDANVFGDSIDRGEHGKGCDESSAPYPAVDTFPDCFHGSSTGNIHFHGTHTNPMTTGDNVFIEVRPSLRKNGKPVVTEASVTPLFNEFFQSCEKALGMSPLVQWPRTWNDLPKGWVNQQIALLKQYDNDPANASCGRSIWRSAPKAPGRNTTSAPIRSVTGCPNIRSDLAAGRADDAAQHGRDAHGAGVRPPARNGPVARHPLVPRAQARLDHDQRLQRHDRRLHHRRQIRRRAQRTIYGAGWTRTQPILVINQLGVSPNL